MDTLLKADIFFFVTAAAVIIVTVFLGIALFYVIRILRTIDAITERVRKESETVMNDAVRLREQLARGGFISGIIARVIAARRDRRTPEPPPDEPIP
jgi:hypothetical protein